MSKDKYKYKYNTFSVLVQFYTGHNFLNRHNAIVDYGYPEHDASLCGYCGRAEESTFHVLTACRWFRRLRKLHFGDSVLRPPIKVRPRAIVRFLREANIFAFTDILPAVAQA